MIREIAFKKIHWFVYKTYWDGIRSKIRLFLEKLRHNHTVFFDTAIALLFNVHNILLIVKLIIIIIIVIIIIIIIIANLYSLCKKYHCYNGVILYINSTIFCAIGWYIYSTISCDSKTGFLMQSLSDVKMLSSR